MSTSSSILNDIKKMLGLDAEYTPFDTDVIILINNSMMVLQQYGVGPKQGFTLTGSEQTWADFFAESDGKMLESVKTYIYLKVKMVFDPPATSFVMDAFKSTCDELEWRLKEQMESYPGDIPREEESAEAQTDEEPETIGGSSEEDTETETIGQSPLNDTGGEG